MDNLLGWLNHPTISSDLINHYNSQKLPLSYCQAPTRKKKIESSLLFNDTLTPNGVKSSVHFGNQQAIVLGNPRWTEHKFRTLAKEQNHASTLIEAYKHHGPQLLNLVRGHFTFCIINTDNNSAFIAINRIGVKTINYSTVNGSGLIFGSSAEIVRLHPDVNTSLDLQSIYNYVYFHVIPSPNTIYSNIKKLEPAHYIIFENGKLETVHYWKPSFAETLTGSVAQNHSDLRNLVKSALLLREPKSTTGAFLSGGLDSSTISGTLAKFLPYAKTYSIGFSEKGYDEMEYAKLASSHFKSELINYYVTADDIVEAIPTIAAAYDEPFGNSSAIPALFCARLAFQNGTRELFAGDGGDELFAGNERYVKQLTFSKYTNVPHWLKRFFIEPLFVSFPLSKYTPVVKKIRSYIMQANMPMPDRMESYNFLQRTATETIFEADFLKNINTNGPLQLLGDVYNRTNNDDNLLNKMLYLDWKFTLADNDIRKVNRMCEIANVDVYYPFLDDEIIEFSTRIPSNIKLKGQELRHFYREAYNNFLPKEIINKEKHGFGLPFGVWLKDSKNLQDFIYSNLSALKQHNIIQPAFIDELIKTHKDGHASYYGTMIWVLVMLQQWFEQHKIKP